MTVCIAALAEANTQTPKIVFAADRLVSAGVNFENALPKIKALTPYAWVLISSNDALASDLIVVKAQETIAKEIGAGKTLSVSQIVDILSNECKIKMKSEKEKQVLTDRFDLTFSEFKKISKDLHEKLIHDIIVELDNFEYGLISQFLVVGIDSAAHIYVVHQDGNIQLCDITGFATVGDGGYLAYPEITKFTYNPNVQLGEALVRVYNAKKVAERVGGVGKQTDIAVLHVYINPDNKERMVLIWEAPPELRALLDKEMEEIRNQEKMAYIGVIGKVFEMFRAKTEQKPEPMSEQSAK
jgi:hypothetical protein